VRELDNVMQRALVLADGPLIGPEHISFEQIGSAPPPRSPPPRLPEAQREAATAATAAGGKLAGTRAAAEFELILHTLRHGGISRERMAERLGISPRTLRYKLARMRAAGIDPKLGSAA
jgi:two-component system response regulator FlrC